MKHNNLQKKVKEVSFWSSVEYQGKHLKPRPFGSSRVRPLTASQIHQAYFADLQQNDQHIS